MTKNQYRKLFSESDWTVEKLEIIFDLIEKTNDKHFQFDHYPAQFEIVSSEQLLDMYASVGLPINYPHWSFGKDYMANKNRYEKGQMGLSYEMIPNANPNISYNLEDNNTCLMTLVYAHANIGHSHFFKNNYLFRYWTNAETIVDYMKFAKDYILKCEERYGYAEVEFFLDACHSLQYHGVDHYKHPKFSLEKEKQRIKDVLNWTEQNYNILDSTLDLPPLDLARQDDFDYKSIEQILKEPQENILYFLEKHTPNLPTWKRELIRIVRKIAQYLYPQGQTKTFNEGTATKIHYMLINKMYDEGYLPESFMIEFLKSHSSVVYQPDWNSRYYSGINPYALGFNILNDVERICTNPTEEDKEWFPNLIGKNFLEEFKYAVKNFRDDSFILQYLSPKVIRDMKLFSFEDDESLNFVSISNIHEEEGYRNIRKILSEEKNRSSYVPNISVVDVDPITRQLMLQYEPKNGMQLEEDDLILTLDYIEHIWQFSCDYKVKK